MKYICISNAGMIERDALHLMGACTKRDQEGKIGLFGTGNKYALSYLLRNNYDVILLSGTDRIKLELKATTFREHTFDVVHIDGQQTSLTTSMGMQWTLWQAIREIYCNARDEGKPKVEFVDAITPEKNRTQFYINITRDLKDVIGNWDNYFAFDKKVLFQGKSGSILEKSGKTVNIYRRGIRCVDTELTSLYDYDIPSLDINEDRMASRSWQVYEELWATILSCDNPEIIKSILVHSCHKSAFERHIPPYSTINRNAISKVFIETARSMRLVPEDFAGLIAQDEIHNFVIIPTMIYSFIEDLLNDNNKGKKFRTSSNGTYQLHEPTTLQTQTLRQALAFFDEVQFKIPYEVSVATFANPQVLGCADRNGIVISDLSLERGVNDTVNTIIEEYIHLRYHVKDETRAFQEAIITEFISYMKQKHAIAI